MSEVLSYNTAPRDGGGRWAEIYPNRAELIDRICERLAEGEPLTQVCKSEGLPAWRTVSDWAEQDPLTAARIARARATGEDAIASDALRIADGQLPIEGQAPDAARDKLRVWTRLQLLAKFNPKRWGDSTQLRHADANGDKIDNAPLVRELLAVMGGVAQPAKPDVIEATALNVTPEPTRATYRPVYRAKARPASDDASDLV